MIAILIAAQLSIVTRVPDTVSSCAPFDITVAARMSGGVVPMLTSFAGNSALQLLKSRFTSKTERDPTGTSSGLVEATYTVAAATPGRITLPPFSATSGSAHASSAAAILDVRANNTPAPSVVVRAWLERLTSSGSTPADTLVVGEQVDYVVDVHLNEAARQRLRRNPTFFPPEMPGVLAYDLAAPSAISAHGQHCFETLSYRRALFPLFAGRSVIAPAALTYSLPLSSSFFSREESFELRTDSVRFVSVDVPAGTRPPSFSGAVGSLGAHTRLSVASARMGDPVVLTLRLEGAGNVKLWPRPPLSIEWGAVTPGPERVEVDTSTSRVRGAKEFDWVLTPRQAGRQQVPGIVYTYFNPERREYQSSSAAPLGLDIAAAALATIDSTPAARLSIRRVLRAETSAPVSGQPWYWALIAGAPLPAIFQVLTRKRRVRQERRSAMRKLRAMTASGASTSMRETRRLFLDAIAERVPGTRGETRGRNFGRTLRLAGVSSEVADRAALLFTELDVASFAGADTATPSLRDEALALAETIDREALHQTNISAVRAVVLVLIALGSSAALALNTFGVLESTFHEGVIAYDHAAYPLARSAFARVAVRAPRSVDAWSNLGSSAYALGDTAAAVRAWERALRLDPLDDDVRDRLQLVQPVSIASAAYVPPVPLLAIALIALVAWYLAWIGVAFRSRVRIPLYSRSAFVAAVAFMALIVTVTRRSRTDSLAVLRVSRMLMDAPSSGTSTSTGVVGETAVIQGREGVWVYVRLDASRAGWLPLASLLPLDSPAD